MDDNQEVEGFDQENLYFDTVIGCIEDMIISTEFKAMQNCFCTQYCSLFEQKDENKLVYTDIFRKYAQMIETYLEIRLQEQIPNFKMLEFMVELRHQQHMLSGEVFEVLLGFTDFLLFKEMMLDFKQDQEGSLCDLQILGSNCGTR